MAPLFVATVVLARPDPFSVLIGALRPSLPEGSLVTVIALIGTTVVSCNLSAFGSPACAVRCQHVLGMAADARAQTTAMQPRTRDAVIDERISLYLERIEELVAELGKLYLSA